jgi:hypothetical protein
MESSFNKYSFTKMPTKTLNRSESGSLLSKIREKLKQMEKGVDLQSLVT